jgi:hypothetical protein
LNITTGKLSDKRPIRLEFHRVVATTGNLVPIGYYEIGRTGF